MSFRFVLPRADVGDGIEDFAGAKLFFFDFGTNDAKITHSDVGLQNQNTDPVLADDDGLFPNIFLDVAYTVTLETANGVKIWGPLDVQSPSDLITALAASAVSVLDVAGNFTAADVEAVLAEIALGWLELTRTNTISGDMSFSNATLFMFDNPFRRPLMIDYGIKHGFIPSISNVTTLDITTGNSFRMTLDENTTVVLANPSPNGVMCEIIVRIHQDPSGGAFTVTWPATVKWPSGVAPVITITNSAIDRITLTTDDEGAVWYGDFSQAYAF